MSTLVIPLPQGLPQAGALLDYALVAPGMAAQHKQTALGLLAGIQADERVVLVPANRLSWHRVTLPKGTLGRSLFADGQGLRIRAVLGGLLEDELLDEPEALHLALQPQAVDTAPVWVAACQREWLQTWLNTLEQSGVHITRIVPEAAPPTAPADSPLPMVLRARAGEHQPDVLLTQASGVLVLPLSADSLGLLRPLLGNPAQVALRAEPTVAAAAEALFQTPFQLQTQADAWAQASSGSWDLAQFDLLRTRGARTRQSVRGWLAHLATSPVWRPARWAAITLLLAQVLGLQAWAWKEQAALNERRSAARSTLTATFPDIKVVVDAPAQMKRAVSDLQRSSGQAGPADLESMLSQLKSAAPDLPVPASIGYQNKTLRLTGLPPENATDAALVQGLQARGYNLRTDGETLVLQTVATP
ncbi:MAG: hypothetical protein RLZZ591_1233 [Pseudomonadota bacterium]|jgi:general secretion pathway protein L